MKKKWVEPKIMIEKFLPNEYVATCGDTYTVYGTCAEGGGSFKIEDMQSTGEGLYNKDGVQVYTNFTPKEEGVEGLLYGSIIAGHFYSGQPNVMGEYSYSGANGTTKCEHIFTEGDGSTTGSEHTMHHHLSSVTVTQNAS